MLPDLMKTLQSAHSDNKMKALLTFRNIIGHLKKKASSIALELAEKLLQLFDDECSQTQELSICLFKEIIQMADWKDKRQMQKKVRRSLVPLMLHMSDEIESVAKASQEAICAAAKVLKWEWLSHHVQTLERWQTVQRLLEQEQSRAEKYVRQSLLYLQHAQVSVRLAAVRFIGKPRPLESLFWQPGPSPICCTGSEEQPCGCQSIDCPVQGLCSQGLSNPCARSGAQWHLAQCHLPLRPVLP
ncbi:maestro heat-like repeat family member 5 [Pezoporus occidentalis]|uniref:maestro heat-like repeat family member 5 n=1 Tax=Pezoporus occidentalis TaxID=407982 RepID=UPI002F9111AA